MMKLTIRLVCLGAILMTTHGSFVQAEANENLPYKAAGVIDATDGINQNLIVIGDQVFNITHRTKINKNVTTYPGVYSIGALKTGMLVGIQFKPNTRHITNEIEELWLIDALPDGRKFWWEVP